MTRAGPESRELRGIVDKWQCIARVLALCRLAGLRRSDAMSLRWSAVNFEDGVITFTTQKSRKDARVPMCAELEQILRGAHRDTLRLDDLVVPQPMPGDRARGRGLVSLSNVKRDVDSIRARAGVEKYGDPLHTLRKSCINDWARRHPPNAVMQWATHSSIHTTMKYYAQVSPEDEKRAREPLGLTRLTRIADTNLPAGQTTSA